MTEPFEVGDVVQHNKFHVGHAERNFGGVRPLTIARIGNENGSATLYHFVEARYPACRHRLELVERAGGPW